MKSEQKLNCEVIAQLRNHENYLVISTDGIYQCKGEKQIRNQIRSNLEGIVLLFQSVSINSHKNYRFLMKFIYYQSQLNFFIDGIRSLEVLFSLMKHSSIFGIHDKINISHKIGQGSFSQVFDITTCYGQRFAAKAFLKQKLSHQQKYYSAYKNQIKLMKNLNSPFIVAFDYVFETQKFYYLKMELFPKSLISKLQEKQLVGEQKKMMKQLLLGLVEMKKHNIIHRDLKPANIMIRGQGKNEECVIIDLGLGVKADEIPYLYSRCGTPGYVAPQIIKIVDRKQRQNCSADMFSLGCIFYKILTNKHLFTGQSESELLYNNKTCHFRNRAFYKLSQLEIDLLLKMLTMRPQERITPEEALLHPYFNEEVDDQDIIPDQECQIKEHLKKIMNPHPFKSMISINSLEPSYIDSLRQGSINIDVTQLHQPSIQMHKPNIQSKKRKSKRKSSNGCLLSFRNQQNLIKKSHFAIKSMNKQNTSLDWKLY